MSKQIPLTQGKFAIVDDEDFERVSQFKWQARPSKGRWYAMMSYWKNGRLHSRAMHRFILNAGPGQLIDHRSLDGLDNRRSNLRFSSIAGNNQNRGMNRRNTSGFKGVSWNRRLGKWVAYCCLDSRKIYLGLFTDKLEAAKAYDLAAILYYGEFARPNFPMENTQCSTL